MQQSLKKLTQTQANVRIFRKTADPDPLNACVLDAGEKWVVLQPFHDFHPEGFSAIRLRDITRLRNGKHERFWQKMLAANGLHPVTGAPAGLPLHQTRDLLVELQRRYPTVILECERDGRFFIGRILNVGKRVVRFGHFDARGRWKKHAYRIPIGRITRIQFATPYEAGYSAHLRGECPHQAVFAER